MKQAFPGDPEFFWDRFYQLPYEYVLKGFYRLQKTRRQELHELELPIALNTAIYANSQRDPKSQKKPFSVLDFTFYQPSEGNGPSAYYAACYMHLLKAKQLPLWALFCYKEVAQSERGVTAGPIPALMAEDAILIGPRKTDLGVTGFLIAQESASGQVREFKDADGNVRSLTVPVIESKVVAEEDVTLS